MTSIISLILRTTLIVGCVALFLARFASGQGTYALTGNGTGGTLTTEGGYNDGFRFVTGDRGITVNWLGIYDAPSNDVTGTVGDGLVSSPTVLLWRESDQALLSSAQILSGTNDKLIGAFRGHVISNVVLVTNTAYRISIYNFSPDRYRDGNDLSGWQTNEIRITGGCYGGGNAYPGSGWGGIIIGPNFGWGTTNPACIQSFGPGAIIDDGALTIAWTLPYGTDLTSLAPTYTVSSGTGVPESGSTNDFTSPVVYTVTDWDLLVSNSYTVTVMAPMSTNKTMLTFGLPGNMGVVAGTSITWSVPYTWNVAKLAPVYTLTQYATCDPPSGSTNDFTTPVTYTVTAQNLSTQSYIVTVVRRPKLEWPVTNGISVWLSGDTINPADTNQVVTTNSTMYVRRWPDQSGNGQDARQTADLTNTEQLVQYVPGDLNGHPTVRWIDTASPTAGDNMRGPTNTTFKTLFFVVKQDGVGPWHYMFGSTAGGQSIGSFQNSWLTPDPGDFAYSSGDPLIWVNGVQTLDHNAQWHIMRAVSETSPSFTYLFDSFNWTGRIAEWIAYSRALSFDETAAVEQYLWRKYFGGVYITNGAFSVSAGSDIVVAGTNSATIVGDMWISNAANNQMVSFPVPTQPDGWVSPAVASVPGLNYVWVCGTNSDGLVASDMLVVTGVPEPAAAAAAAIGYWLFAIRRRD